MARRCASQTNAHSWVSDLTIKLVHPDGTVITVVSRPGVIELGDDGMNNNGAGIESISLRLIE